MLIFFYLVFLCSNFLFIKCEGLPKRGFRDSGSMIIQINPEENCTINRSYYTFMDGQNVSLVIRTPTIYIHFGWLELINKTNPRNLTSELKTTPPDKNEILHTFFVDKSMEGTWELNFFYFMNINDHKKLPRISINHNTYTKSVCKTNVKIVPKEPLPSSNQISSDNKFFITACVVIAIQSIIIIAQTAYIIFLKAKARKLITLNTHNNLSKKTEPVPNDTARYCSNPGQKMMKVSDTVDDDNRDSVIYEAPNIEISGNVRMPMQAPQPPAITTMPRTPRLDHNMKIGPQAILASAMNSPARSPMSGNFPPNIQRPKLDREISVANRPPLPLPTEGHSHPGHPHNNMFQEVYEEMETQGNTYEPPSVINTMPPRLPMPPKKVPTGNLLDVKENTLKLRQGNKPQVTPKPQQSRPNIMTSSEFEQVLRRRNNDTMPKHNLGHMSPMQQELAVRRRPNSGAQMNELEETFRRRNNVMQVPIMSIPDPSSRGSPKPRPPPAVKSKPRGPPIPQPVQEEIYYNENQASSDEEWTYEPLKPLNSYDTNIYNV